MLLLLLVNTNELKCKKKKLNKKIYLKKKKKKFLEALNLYNESTETVIEYRNCGATNNYLMR